MGTSGVRLQAIDLEKNEVISTAITLRHPLPGYNVMDHLHFVLENGGNVAHGLVIETVNKLIRRLDIDAMEIVKLAVCGNPIQMSIFHGIECRDLAFAGDNKLKRLGIKRLTRDATIIKAGDLGLTAVNPEVDVYIPPVVKHAVGGDAIAMVIESKLLEQKGCVVVADFGTNAEMAIKVGDTIYTGSAAAGPAIEGQQIGKGALASPGTISDADATNGSWVCSVLDENMFAKKSFKVNPTNGELIKRLPTYVEPKAITGTGTVALVSEGVRTGLIKPPNILTANKQINLYNDIYFTENDLKEAGHAFGAFRAGYLTLVSETGISFDDVREARMCGASGFYVDASKARSLWLVPTSVEKIYQVGNTSLAMAGDVIRNPSLFDYMQEVARDMRNSHLMFANSEAFSQAYVLELGYWDEGMPIEKYMQLLNTFSLPKIIKRETSPKVTKLIARDIPDFGVKGLRMVREIGVKLVGSFDECVGCKKCQEACLEGALTVVEENGGYKIVIRSDLCDGVSCKKCQVACPRDGFDFQKLRIVEA